MRGDVPAVRHKLRGSLADNEEFRQLTGNRPPPMRDFVVTEGLAVALEIKAAKDDRIFLEFGPQVIVERGGPRVLTPDAMDVIAL